MTQLLIFLGQTPEPWLRLDAAGITARGDDPALIPPGEDERIVAVVPGESIVLHWVELPRLAPAQAAAAARMLAADVAAGPITATHVALGEPETDGRRALALVDDTLMRGWLARLAALGLTPDAIVPLPLLLPASDGVTMLTVGEQVNARGPQLAFAAEADVAALILDGHVQHPIDTAAFEAALPESLAAAPVNLRQGRFAARADWQPARQRVRRLALLATAAAAMWLIAGAAGLIERQRAAARAETQLTEAAAAALPRGTIVTDPRGQVAARLAALGGGDRSFSAMTTQLMAVLRDRPTTALRSLQYTSTGGLNAVVESAAPEDGAALARALSDTGVNAAVANPRIDGDKHVVDLTMKGQ
jgi:general secretion pathway protein L